MKKILQILLVAFFALTAQDMYSCTSAIITGKLTPDGRPLLYKNRDTGELNNRVEHFTGFKYNFLALVNSPDSTGIAWAGTNSVGFSIMNTASYNLKNDDVKEMDKEGEVMFKALAECKTLKDFEKMLNKMPKPWRVEANFGVIDANGGAAYYEVNNTTWTKIDVNDPKIAPDGYLVYTNHSYTGRYNDGMGYIRYNTANKTFMDRVPFANITPSWIMDNISRSFYHSLLDIDLVKDMDKIGNSGFFIDQDFVPRRSTSAVVIVQGVKPEQDPSETVMWTSLGYPPVAVTVPVMEKYAELIPDYMTKTSNSNNAEFCDLSLALKRQIFPVRRGNGKHYFKFSLLYNNEGTGYTQILKSVDKTIENDFNEVAKKIKNNDEFTTALIDFYRTVGKNVIETYNKIL